jgi:membrane associated rhomboid family serine protease
MLSLSEGIPAKRFPMVNVGLIVANFAVWLFYELPHLRSSVYHASLYYPCSVDGANGGGVAFFAHVEGFVFGFLVTTFHGGTP